MTALAEGFRRHLGWPLLLLWLCGCSTLVPVPAGVPVAADEAGATAAQAAWARVLQRFVNDRGEVDFQALSTDRGDLELMLRYIAETPIQSLPAGPVRTAHEINAYNALSMFNIVDSGIPEAHVGLHKLRFFVLRRFNIGGRPMSLYGFENDVIRPEARLRNDPRIHFALNCSARSCPALPRTPFTADRLNAQLDRETRAFFADPRNFRIDSGARTVWLSELLEFYPEDFVPDAAGSLLAYANRYAPEPAPPEYAVMFTPYDWTVAN
ncbi:MAG: DUF547 domain-containing protein, partial [Pseudomonadota bacterium]|nr:DUF547 domain-containing protein [Pseudomonadota bacterium]